MKYWENSQIYLFQFINLKKKIKKKKIMLHIFVLKSEKYFAFLNSDNICDTNCTSEWLNDQFHFYVIRGM
jgi:hypothetical protein